MKKKLRVFEAFAGIGAQASALDRLNIDYEIVGISDWFIDAIECYAAIHCENVEVDVPQDIKEIDESVAERLQSELSEKGLDCRSILIIDDEADNASITTSKDPEKPTTINRCIRDIFNKFPIASYHMWAIQLLPLQIFSSTRMMMKAI